ncbi:replication/maintenance protein RepL [Geothrix paludis]|uniref:replication/maintenance protein RepL n=1 Tax=Geothrix paludis TaxID=2922722 RepID=UPI001FAE306A|nr:replication/maintenance protein RepL [Geothrix paludis]
MVKIKKDPELGSDSKNPLLAAGSSSPIKRTSYLTIQQRQIFSILGIKPEDPPKEDESTSVLDCSFPVRAPDKTKAGTKKTALKHPDRLLPTELRVLLHLFSRMEFRNWVLQGQVTLARELGITAQAYSSALKRLQEFNILIRPWVRTSSGTRPCILLNPLLVNRGKKEDQEKAEALFLKLAGKISRRGPASRVPKKKRAHKVRGSIKPDQNKGTSQPLPGETFESNSSIPTNPDEFRETKVSGLRSMARTKKNAK